MIDKKKYNVLWFGPVSEPSGYGVASRGYLKELVKHKDIQLKLVNKYFWGGDRLDLSDEERDLFEVLADNECLYGIPTLAVYHLTPDHYKIIPKVDKHVCLTTFETDSLPDYWLMPMRSMDEVWTYSQFNNETFRNAKIGNPISVIPHGVDIGKFNPNIEPMEDLKEVIGDKFAFGSVFDWHGRKNPELLVESFLRAFEGDEADKVCLVLKTFYNWVEDGDEFIRSKIKEIKEKVGKNKKLSEIFVLSDILSSDDIPKFYATLDCYVSPSKGEGWGLPFLESMATGLPVIATNWGGNTEFMTSENSYLLPYQLEYIKKEDSEHHPYFKEQRWAEVRQKDLITKFKDIYFDQKTARQVGELARKDACNFSWENAGNIMYENIVRILS